MFFTWVYYTLRSPSPTLPLSHTHPLPVYLSGSPGRLCFYFYLNTDIWFYVTMKSRNQEWERRHICLSDTGLIHLMRLFPVASNTLKTLLTLRLWGGFSGWGDGGWPWGLEGELWLPALTKQACSHQGKILHDRDCRVGPGAIKTYSEFNSV